MIVLLVLYGKDNTKYRQMHNLGYFNFGQKGAVSARGLFILF